MNTFSKAALMAAGLLIGGQALAQPSYNYVSGGYSSWDVDLGSGLGSTEPDGLTLAGSFLVSDHIFLGYDFYLVESTFRSDEFMGEVRVDEETMLINLKGGFRTPINQTGDFVGTLGYVRVDTDFDMRFTDTGGNVTTTSDSVDTDGFTLGLGIRQMLTPEFEVSVMLDHWDLDDTDTGFVFGANYDFTRNLGVGGSYRIGSDIEILNVGLRFSF